MLKVVCGGSPHRERTFISAGSLWRGSSGEGKQHSHFVCVSDNNDLCKLLNICDLLPREVEFFPLCRTENIALLSSSSG
jgi:hypothetical protein